MYSLIEPEVFRAMISAFMGAFFAFMFVRFGEFLKKIHDRQEANDNALIKLQYHFNFCLNTTSDNIFIVNKIVDEIFTEANLASSEPPINSNIFYQYPINWDTAANLTNVEYLQEISAFNANLHKMNESLQTIDRGYSQIRDAFFGEVIDISTYKINARIHRDKCEEMRGFLIDINDDIIKLISLNNLQLNDRPFIIQVVRILVRSSYHSDFSVRLPLEQERVKAEIAKFAEASAEKIRKAQGK
jgi:hypothetical protein